MHCPKIAVPIEMPFGMLSCVSPENHILDRMRIGATGEYE